MKGKNVLAIMAGMTLAVSGLVFAHGGGSMGSGGPMMGNSGMMVVADDGSLLVTNMDMEAMMNGSGQSGTITRSLVNIAPDGTERWSVDFADGWPMMPATEGNLVVVVLVNDWFMGNGSMGDTGWNGGSMGGGMMGVTAQNAGSAEDQATVVGIDLATGQERWRTTLNGDMGSMVQFAPDGSRIYISVMTMGTMGNTGSHPMQQGQAASSSILGSATVVALDPADGHQLWSYDLGTNNGGTGGGMGGMSARRVR